MGSIYVICSRQCPNGDGIYILLYALYKYSTSITNQPNQPNLQLTMIEQHWGQNTSQGLFNWHVLTLNLGMHKQLYPSYSMRWNYLSIPELQRLHR